MVPDAFGYGVQGVLKLHWPVIGQVQDLMIPRKHLAVFGGCILCQFTAAEPYSKLPSKLFKFYPHDREPRTYSSS